MHFPTQPSNSLHLFDVFPLPTSSAHKKMSAATSDLPPSPVSPTFPPPLPSSSASATRSFPRDLPPRPRHRRAYIEGKQQQETLAFLVEDDELRDVPAAFLHDIVEYLAPRLIAGVQSVSPVAPPPSSSSSSAAAAAFLPPATIPCLIHSSPDAISPTHLLAISFSHPSSFSSSSSSSSPSAPPAPAPVLFPIHTLPWGLASATVARLLQSSSRPPPPSAAAAAAAAEEPVAPPPPSSIFSSPPSALSSSSVPPQSSVLTSLSPAFPSPSIAPSGPPKAPFRPQPAVPSVVHLPVLPLSLPSSSSSSSVSSCPSKTREAFDLLYRWIYGRDIDLFWESLVCAPRSRVDMSDVEDAEERLGRIGEVWRVAEGLGIDLSWGGAGEEAEDDEEEEEEGGEGEREGVWEVLEEAWEAVWEEWKVATTGERRGWEGSENESESEGEWDEEEEEEGETMECDDGLMMEMEL